MLYSHKTGGFYCTSIHGDSIPDDAVSIKDSEYIALLKGQSNGLIISASQDGRPILVEPPAPSGDQAIKAQIAGLESQQTPRRIREAALGTDGGWLARLDEQIAALRAKLT